MPGGAFSLALSDEIGHTAPGIMLKYYARLIAKCLLPFLAVALPSCIHFPESPEVHRVAVRADAPVIKTASVEADREPDVKVWLLADNLHTGMVLPYDWLLESGFRPPKGFPKAKYVSMSWGNRVAYTKKEWLSVDEVLKAFFTPSPSVMEIIPFDYNVVEVCHYQRIWQKLVPRERGPVVAAFLNSCVNEHQDGAPVVIAPSSWGKGFIMESPYKYYLPRICNIWTLRVMEACGCRVQPWGGLTADGVIRQAERPWNGFEKVWDAYDVKTP